MLKNYELIQNHHESYLFLQRGTIVEKLRKETLKDWSHFQELFFLCVKVHLFDQMDERTLDVICERLKPALCTEGTFLVREGDPVNEMLFIIRGHLDSYTINGGRIGFFNSCRIGLGDFSGKELLTWALDPSPSIILPSSICSVKTLFEVEAFALRADDLKFVASLGQTCRCDEVEQQ
ncbi:putative cyclic nucleotide-gated ion channel 15 [Eucalyptus grandis]|uniref:putative cyclic nucleotide-gated ion channel 15 n=1 Tax=Eucalyptus grandis TaxID=71139 RepID=UPI00192ED222|nr:putative cyclic nucleotide-gated ion channel 15 [Eucalyptus grandis]